MKQNEIRQQVDVLQWHVGAASNPLCQHKSVERKTKCFILRVGIFFFLLMALNIADSVN